MSAITPQTELRLIKLPLEFDSKNQVNFSNKNNQYNYFSGLPHLTIDNITYQRKDGVIRYPAHIDTLLQYNYCMYQNENYTNKWFYAFITKMEYINDNMTAITIETDSWQTWCFDLEFKQSFIEREHVSDDRFGMNTIPENLETGDYIIESGNISTTNPQYVDFTDSCYICVGTGKNVLPVSLPSGSSRYNSVFSGLIWYVFRNVYNLQLFITYVRQSEQYTDNDIVVIYMIPKEIATIATSDWHTYSGFEYSFLPYSDGAKNMGIEMKGNMLGTYGDFTPVNNKTNTYPYRYMRVNNHLGGETVYKYELFNLNGNIGKNCVFRLYGTSGVGCSIKVVPINYLGSGGSTPNWTESTDCGKLPTCSWVNDTYLNYLTQNSLNITWQRIGGAFGVVAGSALIATGIGTVAGAGMVAGGIGQITSSMLEQAEVSKKSNGTNGENQTDIVFASGHFVELEEMRVKQEIARSVDNYFTMFGYKINKVKTPQITSRRYWNYIKTIDVAIHGLIPEEDLNKIKSLFNSGITFWHDTSKFLDYSQNNSIV